jgi:hypothetical protein
MGTVPGPPVHSVGFRRLDGRPVALVEQDEFLASYLQAALEHHGAVVTNVRGTLEDMTALLRGATPRPMVAAVDAMLSEKREIIDLLAQLGTPYLLVAEKPASPRETWDRNVQVWRWPFGAFQVVAALGELLDPGAVSTRSVAPDLSSP